ncbi:MAG: c-type cytochrome [Vicinamibacterales bacterium]
MRGVSPEEEQKRFVLHPGYRMTPVLTDPIIEEPMQVAFDGNGRMFVLENRGYMQDADSTGELDPVGRISVHEDVDNDGVYEKHAIFVDHLVFPRFVLPFGPGAVLSMESNTDNIYKFTDTDGDGKSDKKELFETSFGRSGNVEHQQSSLFWGMDNWMYSTYNQFRIRWSPTGRVLRESTGSNGAQWGITQDSYGKVYFQGGASGLPGYFQYPIHYGNVNVPDRFEPGLEVPWGVVGLADFQPGFEAVRLPNQTLNRVTGAAGNEVFRGDRLPADLAGDYLYGEPVARIVRRLRDVGTEGVPRFQQVYQWQYSEFVRSTDPLFRPVDLTTAPDGTLYVVDTYRGIIQEGNWTRPGSYLRQKIDQYDLDKNIRKGRIWRLTYDGIGRDTTRPRMHDETSAQLLTRLEHANGWWRDTAQELLVLRQDKSVVPALQRMARSSANVFGRFHALWTLEGLGALDATLTRALMKDAAPDMRIQAIRASETLYKAGDRSFLTDYRVAASDANENVVVQALLTLKLFNAPDLETTVRAAQAANPKRGVTLVGNHVLAPPSTAVAGGGGGRGTAPVTPEAAAVIERGTGIYAELCFSCHGTDGTGAAREGGAPGALRAPPLAGAPRVQGHRDYVIRALLHGLTGPVDGQTYSEVMIPMGSNDDTWIAAVATYVRNSFGNQAGAVTAADVARVRAASGNRRAMWTVPEAEGLLPVLVPSDTATWKTTASHNSQMTALGLGYVSWSSTAPQQPGMWYQVELPAPILVAEIQFESTPGGRVNAPTGAFAAGGGGRGGRGAPAPPPPPGSGAPRGYEIRVSVDGVSWSAPLAQGQGALSNAIAVRPVQAKFVRITQTGTDPNYPWSIQRLRLYRAPGGAR